MKLVSGTLRMIIFSLIPACLAPVKSMAQVPIDTVQQLFYSRYDFSNKALIQVYKDHLRLADPKTGKGKTFPAPGAGDITREFEPFLSRDTVWFVKRGSGLVYQLRNDSIIRIDHSFDHRMQADAVEFVRNDTLFRHGGYGMWSAIRHITFFDPHTLEWEIERPLNSTEFPAGMYRHQVVPANNEAWFFGGLTAGQSDPLATAPNREVWRYHFNDMRWELMGESNPVVNLFDREMTSRIDTEEPGKFILFPVTNQTVAIDLIKNSVSIHHQSKVNLHLYYLPYYTPFILEGRLYYYRLLSNVPKKYEISPFYDLEFCSIPVSMFLGELIREEEFYSPPVRTSVWVAGLATLIAFGGITFVFRKSRNVTPSGNGRKLTVTPEGLMYGTKLHKLEQKSLAILKRLLETEGDVFSADILEMVQNPNLDFSHNTRVKNQIMNTLNLELKTLLGEKEDIIQIERSPIDRRIKTYRIRKELFDLG